MKVILKTISSKDLNDILNGKTKVLLSNSAPKGWKAFSCDKTDKKPEPCEVYLCRQEDNKIVASFTLNYVEFYSKNWRCFKKDFNFNEEKHWLDTALDNELISQEEYDDDFSDLRLFPELLDETGLTQEELAQICGTSDLYVWYVSNLEAFNPMQLNQFFELGFEQEYKSIKWLSKEDTEKAINELADIYAIKSAPKTWRYVEL